MEGMTPAHALTPSAPGAVRPPGLRERKKAKTRRAIREATYALIRERGYDATTVERIAERAEVSPSTVPRCFPTKEDIVATDEYAPLVRELLLRRPADEPVPESIRWALRRATALTLGDHPHPGSREETVLRVRLMAEVPAVRTRLRESMSVTGRLMCRALAGRTGRGESDLEVRVYAMGLMAALLEALVHWAEHDCRDDLTHLTDRALDAFRDLAAPGSPQGSATGSPQGPATGPPSEPATGARTPREPATAPPPDPSASPPPEPVTGPRTGPAPAPPPPPDAGKAPAPRVAIMTS
ncbi:hypothetical protein SUDANB145_02735 [Streptomyces sp. enrichment culture]